MPQTRPVPARRCGLRCHAGNVPLARRLPNARPLAPPWEKRVAPSPSATARSPRFAGKMVAARPRMARAPPGRRLQGRHDCTRFGKCTVREGICVVGSAEDCERSELCKRQGYCGFTGGKCVLESNADCQKSDICRVSGRCTYDSSRTAAARCRKPAASSAPTRTVASRPTARTSAAASCAKGSASPSRRLRAIRGPGRGGIDWVLRQGGRCRTCGFQSTPAAVALEGAGWRPRFAPRVELCCWHARRRDLQRLPAHVTIPDRTPEDTNPERTGKARCDRCGVEIEVDAMAPRSGPKASRRAQARRSPPRAPTPRRSLRSATRGAPGQEPGRDFRTRSDPAVRASRPRLCARAGGFQPRRRLGARARASGRTRYAHRDPAAGTEGNRP